MKRTQTGTTKKAKGNIAGNTFKDSFSSEALLQQAIAGLLTKMPDNSGVQILQGSQELGKDLIFYKRGGFEEAYLCACVVKNSKITGSAAGKGGARTILIQAEQAFDSIYTDNFGRDIRVERVYVVTPYDLPPETINSIKGRLQERSGQVVFIGGTTLYDLFKKYWPDYFADEAEMLERHLAETKGVYEAESPLQGLATQYNLGDVSHYPRKIYVSQNLYRDINSYALESSFSAPLPSLDYVSNKKFRREEIQFIQDALNDFRRGIKFLNEWGFCSNSEKDAIFSSSAEVVSALLNTRKKQEDAGTQIQLLAGKERELESIVKEKANRKGEDEHAQLKLIPEKDRKLARQEKACKREIKTLSEKLKTLAAEKIAEFSAATEAMKSLQQHKKLLIGRLDEQLANVPRTLASKRGNCLEALGDRSFSDACILDDCVCAAPEGMFTSKNVGKLIFPRDILERWGGHLLIVGAPGYGKTSFCRWHALEDAESFSAGKTKIIPVYVPLYRFTNKPLGSFEESFLENLGKSALLGEIHSSVDIKVRLYLDGLDEIASVERRREVVELARAGAVGGRYQVILTSRDYIFASWLDWFPRVTLGGFEDDDIRELVDRWLVKDSDSSKRFFKQLDELPALYHLMKTPLLATLIIMVFRQTGKLPENRTRLYENFIGLLSGGWDLAKGLLRKSSYGERIKVQVLSALAANLQEQRRREFYGQDIKTAIKATLSGRMLKEWETFKEEFITDGLISKSGKVLQFAHHSFQEFLTAKNYMGSPQPTRANHALDAYLRGNDWWKEVVRFYIGLSTNPAEVEEWILSRRKLTSTLETQTQNLRTAMQEAFPEYSSTAIG